MIRVALIALVAFTLSVAPACLSSTEDPSDEPNETDPPPPPAPVGDLTVVDGGEGVSATTNGFEDTLLGPLTIGDVTFTLRVPAVALEADVTLTMAPVSFDGAPFEDFGAVRFGPAGTVFRVPALLTAEGVGDAVVAAATLDDEGRDAALTFTPNRDGVAEVRIEHFSVASIVDAATTRRAIGAAGLDAVPTASTDAAPALSDALADHVLPAIADADESIATFAFAGRLLIEWQAAVNARDLLRSPFSGLGGRTFERAGDDALAELLAAGQRLFNDLSAPTCRDGTGDLSHPYDWLGALGYVAGDLRALGGADAEPDVFAPCFTLELPSAVLNQGRSITRDERLIELFVGLDATSPTGLKAPIHGSYVLSIEGGTGPLGLTTVLFDAPSPALHAITLDRGEVCEDRASIARVVLTAVPKGLREVSNLVLEPAEATITYSEPVPFLFGPMPQCAVPTVITLAPELSVIAPGDTLQLTATTDPPGVPVTWFATEGTVDENGLFTAPDTQAVALVEVLAPDGSFAAAQVAVVPPGIYTANNAVAITETGSVNQGALWTWTLEIPSPDAQPPTFTLRRAERTSDPTSPAFEVSVPVASLSGDVIRLGDPGVYEFFNVTLFEAGGLRVDVRGPGLPPGIDIASQLFDVVGWSNLNFPPL